ncbi:MAG: hypothetical protein IT377_00745 [Polyangiaceae bacterium]|nr:hypothetical protein [Polyangiaceae bacterium]
MALLLFALLQGLTLAVGDDRVHRKRARQIGQTFGRRFGLVLIPGADLPVRATLRWSTMVAPAWTTTPAAAATAPTSITAIIAPGRPLFIAHDEGVLAHLGGARRRALLLDHEHAAHAIHP